MTARMGGWMDGRKDRYIGEWRYERVDGRMRAWVCNW